MSYETKGTAIVECEQLVIFELANEYYGVNISSVNTIIRMQEITSIPGSLSFVDGVINLRGSIIPVVDLKMRFGLPASEHTKASRIVVVEAEGQMIGMTVDAVAETVRLPIDAIEPPSPVISSVDMDCMRGVGKLDDRLLILLNLEKILAGKEFASISKTKQQAIKSQKEEKAA